MYIWIESKSLVTSNKSALDGFLQKLNLLAQYKVCNSGVPDLKRKTTPIFIFRAALFTIAKR